MGRYDLLPCATVVYFDFKVKDFLSQVHWTTRLDSLYWGIRYTHTYIGECCTGEFVLDEKNLLGLVFVIHKLVLFDVKVHCLVVLNGLIRCETEVVQIGVELMPTDGNVITDWVWLSCGTR